MAHFKTLLLLLLSSNLLLQCHARAAPSDDWDDWGNDSEEASKEDEPSPDQRSLSSNDDAHSHDDHKNHILSASPSESAPKSGFSGGSVSNYNESCDNKECNPNHNLRCDASSRKCACLPAHVYIRNQEKCYAIWRLEGGQSCEFHEQCENGKMGSLSRCDRVKGTCDCYDTFTGGKRPIGLLNGVCYVKRSINETCELDAECQTTMKTNAYCTPDTFRRCSCQKGFVWDPYAQECFKIADKGLSSDCRSHYQCTASPMGDLARCNELTKKCECHDPKNPGQDNVSFYEKNGACYEKKFMNSTCSLSEECKASVSADAECLQQKDDSVGGTMLLVCQCPPGRKCAPVGEGGGALAIRGWNEVLLLVGVALVSGWFRG